MEIRLSNGLIINEYGLQAAFPEATFPTADKITPDMLKGLDCDVIVPIAAPVASRTQRVSRYGIELVEGVWLQKWIVHVFTAEELAAADAAQTAATIKGFSTAMQAFFDSKAMQRNYDNRLSCSLRAGYAGPFQSEGTAFAQWMDACNVVAYTVMSQVKAGKRAIPTFAALVAEFPALVWP